MSDTSSTTGSTIDSINGPATAGLCPDMYNFLTRCDDQSDPCLPSGTTLYHVLRCDSNDGTYQTFCNEYAEHPMCALTTNVGTPPALPATGTAEGVVIGLGVSLLMAGTAIIAIARRHAR